MLEHGTVLARKAGDGPAAIRVGGLAGGRYVCASVDFGPNLTYSPEELRLLYGAENPEIVEKFEQEDWAKLSTTAYKQSGIDARRAEAERAALPSPEAAFAKAAAAEAEAGFTRKIRRTA